MASFLLRDGVFAWGAVAGLLACSLACSSAVSDASDETEVDEGAIVGGTRDAKDVSVVALVSPNRADWVCSGTVIAPRVVLTAAHCLAGGNYDKTGWSFRVFFGADKNRPRAGDRFIEVVGQRMHDTWANAYVTEPTTESAPTSATSPSVAVDAADIAVVYLAQDAPVPALPWNRGDASTLRGAEARFAGFGLDRAQGGTKGARREAATRIDEVTDAELVTARGPSPCHGDSGGPLFVRARSGEVLVGVARTTVDDTTCRAGATYLRTDLHAAFIDAALAAAPPR